MRKLLTPLIAPRRGPHRAALALGVLALTTSCGSPSKTAQQTTTTAPTTTTATATTPARRTPAERRAASLILALLKAPKQSSLPASLDGSTTQATPLSSGSRKHRAAGAIVTTNGGALVGYLVFRTRADALADLRAFPPNSGPNKLVGHNIPGFPKPSFVLSGVGNGYVVRYVVFVDGAVVVNTWAYGQRGKAKERLLLRVVERNAAWALKRLTTVSRTVK